MRDPKLIDQVLKLYQSFGPEADQRSRLAEAQLTGLNQGNQFNANTSDLRQRALQAGVDSAMAGTDAQRSQTNLAEQRAPVSLDYVAAMRDQLQQGNQRSSDLHQGQMNAQDLQNRIGEQAYAQESLAGPRRITAMDDARQQGQTEDIARKAGTVATLSNAYGNEGRNVADARAMGGQADLVLSELIKRIMPTEFHGVGASQSSQLSPEQQQQAAQMQLIKNNPELKDAILKLNPELAQYLQ